MKKEKVVVMSKKNIIKFLLKYILPTILIMIFLTIYNYLMGGGITPFNKGHIIIFLGFLFLVIMFWGIFEAYQITLENFCKSNWKGKIVFILIAIFLIVLYKISGRI